MFRKGTHRARAPEATLAVATPYLAQAGITRLADITGLDRIGIPTILSIRPNAKTLSICAGKGISLVAAKVSAVMEGIEIHQAENNILPAIRASWREMAERSAIIPAELLPLAKNALFTKDWPYHWCAGWDIVAQRETATPVFIVNMTQDKRRSAELGAFQVTSNGLASGNNFLEALTAGMLEVVERDATALAQLRWKHRIGGPARLRLDSIEDPVLRPLLDQIAAAEVETLLFDCRNDSDIPVYMAIIRDLRDARMGLYKGYGAHLDPPVAASRAITEAVQSRAVYIAGSRDELFKQHFIHLKQSDPGTVTEGLTRGCPLVDWRQEDCEATDTFEGDVAVILEKLRAIGLDSVIVHDLTGPDCPVSVLKVVIPGAEGYVTDWYAPGPRARAFLESLQN